jgi:hypothetical protein
MYWIVPFLKQGKNSHIDIPTNQSKLSRERYGMLFLKTILTYCKKKNILGIEKKM